MPLKEGEETGGFLKLFLGDEIQSPVFFLDSNKPCLRIPINQPGFHGSCQPGGILKLGGWFCRDFCLELSPPMYL